jgi:transposase-like protein
MIENGSYYLKIKELYAILEVYENFDQVFDYIKNRLKAISDVYEQSGQFSNLLETLSQKIKENENRFNSLIRKYENVLKEFESFHEVFKEIEEIDGIFKKKNLII